MRVTERRRQWMFAFATILLLACFLTSFLLFACAVYIKVNIDSHIHFLEYRHSAVLPSLFVVAAILSLLVNAAAFYVHYNIRYSGNRTRLFWLCCWLVWFVFVLVLIYLILVLAALIHLSVLDNGFGVGLHRGMSQYSKGAELKREIDNVQIEYWCCGDEDYTDWFLYPWMSPGSLVLYESRKIKHLQDGGGYYSDNVPFSCCDPQSPRPCIHHHVHTENLHENYHHDKETTLYIRGCREALMEVYKDVLLTVGLVALLITVLQFLALLLMRLLQTSLRHAQECCCWTACTEGYIFRPSRRCCPRQFCSTHSMLDCRRSRGQLLDSCVGLSPAVRASRSRSCCSLNANASRSNMGLQSRPVSGYNSQMDSRHSRRALQHSSLGVNRFPRVISGYSSPARGVNSGYNNPRQGVISGYASPARAFSSSRPYRVSDHCVRPCLSGLLMGQSDDNNCYDPETDGGSDDMRSHDNGRSGRDVLYFSSGSEESQEMHSRNLLTNDRRNHHDTYHGRGRYVQNDRHNRHDGHDGQERHDRHDRHYRNDRHDKHDIQDRHNRHNRHDRHDRHDAHNSTDRHDRRNKLNASEGQYKSQAHDKNRRIIKTSGSSRKAKAKARARLSRGSLLRKSIPQGGATNNSNVRHVTSGDESSPRKEFSNQTNVQHSRKQDRVSKKSWSFLNDAKDRVREAMSGAHRKSHDSRRPYKYSALPTQEIDNESTGYRGGSDFCNHNSSFDFENERLNEDENIMPQSALLSANKPTDDSLAQNCKPYLHDLL